MSGWSAQWRRAVAAAVLVGCAVGALTGCASREQRAEDTAVAEMTGQLSDLQGSAKSALQSSPDRDGVRQDFAVEQGTYVYASSIHGDAITWRIALVGQGGFSTSGSSSVIRLRSCLQMRSAAALDLALHTVSCPARFTSSPNFETTDREIDFLNDFATH